MTSLAGGAIEGCSPRSQSPDRYENQVEALPRSMPRDDDAGNDTERSKTTAIRRVCNAIIGACVY